MHQVEKIFLAQAFAARTEVIESYCTVITTKYEKGIVVNHSSVTKSCSRLFRTGALDGPPWKDDAKDTFKRPRQTKKTES